MQQIIRERVESIRQLEEKSREDENLRRGLHNQIQELKGNIRVFCRVRPGGSQGEEEPMYQFPPNTDNRALEITCTTVCSLLFISVPQSPQIKLIANAYLVGCECNWKGGGEQKDELQFRQGVPTGVYSIISLPRDLPTGAERVGRLQYLYFYVSLSHLAFLAFYLLSTSYLITNSYGQTGSGKTYTMEGPPRTADNTTFGVLNDEHRGMIPRTVCPPY
jgi:hypothetical protein